MDLSGVVAIYGALVSSALGVLRVFEFLEGRRRIHFSVSYSTLLSGGPIATRTNLITIDIGNRGPVPIQLSSVGLRLRDKSGLALQQVAELWHSQQLPARVEPSSGFVMGLVPKNLGEAIGGANGVTRLARVYCTDGAGRVYSRRLSKRELTDIRKAIEAEPAAPTAGPA